MQLFNQQVRLTPTPLSVEESETRNRLIQEEVNELVMAFYKRDIYEIADALADLLYVVYGTCNSCGIDINPIFEEVHRSNMTKVGGTINEYGKLIKPETYSPPNLIDLIDNQRRSWW